jgi:hypothetical protein
MLPKYHFILSFILSFLLLIFNVNPIFCLLFFLSGFLIDTDHFIYYVQKKKDFNLRNAYYYNKNYLEQDLKRKNQTRLVYIFHTVEFLIILFVLSLFSELLWSVLLGCLFHILTDFISEISSKHKKYKRVYSLIFYAAEKKRIEKSGH